MTGLPHYPQWRIYDGFEKKSGTELRNGVPVTRRRHPGTANPWIDQSAWNGTSLRILSPNLLTGTNQTL